MMVRYLCLLFTVLAVSGCGSVVQPCPASNTGDVVYVVGQKWHVEIGIPVEELGKDLSFYREIFVGARVIMFGYGKKTFFTAPRETISEYFLGPFPGPAVIQVVGLTVTPVEVYSGESTTTLALPPGGSRALSAYIWNDLAKDAAGKPLVVAHSTDSNGLFYAAQSEYTLLHTCNTWIADALNGAGLPVSGDNVIFSGQVMTRVGEAAESQCH
jgi:hypothetical protein